jgi:hypothetical protein
VPFGIKTDDRRRHMYLIGKTGMGKTSMMENMAIQDIRNGHGIAFLDPHGDSVQRILNCIPPSRVNDPVKDIEIANNLLDKNGLLIINTPDSGSLIASTLGKNWHLVVPPEHVFYFNKKSISEVLKKNNFEIINITNIISSFSN